MLRETEEELIHQLNDSGARWFITVPALLEKARYVVQVMRERMEGLGACNELLTTIDVYTVHPLRRILAEVIATEISATTRLGVHWYHARPPVEDIEFEMDMRGVRREIVVEL